MKFNRFNVLMLAGFLLLLAACGEESSTDSAAASVSGADDGEVTTITIAYGIAAKPITYQDEDGNPTGYEVEVMKLVDEKLGDYEFEYIGTSDEDILMGVAQGKYDVGLKNAFFTEERLDTYLFPEEFIGLSGAGLMVRKEHEGIQSFSDFASAALNLAPINAGDARYTVVDEYNQENPDNPINLQANDGSVVDDFLWVNEGRVDGAFSIEGSFNATVVSEDGPYHNLVDDLVYNEVAVIKTYPLLALGQDEFANSYDEAIKELKEEGVLSELMLEYYGRDYFEVLDTVER